MSPVRARRGLLIVWLLLGTLVLGIMVIELTEHLASSTGGGDARMLLPVPVHELGAIEIAEAGRLHRFERDAAGTWFYHGVHTGAQAAHTHDPDPARAERIERAFAAFGRTRVERDFALDRERESTAYGVTTPEILVLVYRPNQSQPLAQYAVGHVAPDTVSRYVLVVGGRKVVTIPTYQIDNLVALIQAVGDPPSQPGPSSEDRR